MAGYCALDMKDIARQRKRAGSRSRARKKDLPGRGNFRKLWAGAAFAG